MPTNPDFDWDEVIVSKKPKQKEIDVSFTSDPDLTLGSIEVEDAVERPVSSVARPECGLQSCTAADDYFLALPYDEMVKCYGVRGEFFTVDTPAAIAFRIADTNNAPNQQILDNFFRYNIRGDYPMLSAQPISGAPCENFYDRQFLDATFLNGVGSSNVAFYPRAFENLESRELGPGESLNVKTVMGNMIFDRDEFGGFYSSPTTPRTNFGYMRIVATGKNSSNGLFDGFNAGGLNAGLATSVVTANPGQLSSEVDLVADSIDFFTTDGNGFPVQDQRSIKIDSEDFGADGGEYMPLGTQTGAYMVKLEMDIQMAQDGNSCTLRMFSELEHVKTGRKVALELNSTAVNLNGGLKISSPWSVWGGFYTNSYDIGNGNTATYNTRGGMEGTTRYFAGNSNVSRSLWLIAYDGWEKENVVRKACIEMERSRPSWDPRPYCSRIL